ncbi:MAG: hypothetical protein QOE90_3282 [Thermoplasmata archaeon]|jgi:hypothetical protein|nr:hypothetical protein [Thermoplasmata archaeon]
MAGLVVAAAPASAGVSVCAPGAFPAKPLPGGIIGTTWDTVKQTYDGSPVASFCTPDTDGLVATVTGAAETSCDVLAGESCEALANVDCGNPLTADLTSVCVDPARMGLGVCLGSWSLGAGVSVRGACHRGEPTSTVVVVCVDPICVFYPQ